MKVLRFYSTMLLFGVIRRIPKHSRRSHRSISKGTAATAIWIQSKDGEKAEQQQRVSAVSEGKVSAVVQRKTH
jgi:hypothetical protein